MKLKKLLKGIKARINRSLPEVDITSVSADSRNVKRGGLFFAIEGLRFDGHRFVDDALKKGAVAAVVDRHARKPLKKENIIKVPDTRKAFSVAARNFFKSPSEKLKVIGITGTNGKTTVSFLTESILNAAGIPCGVIGTIEYRTGRARPVHEERTTPDALSLNALLEGMRKNKFGAVAMEVSSHALDQKRVDDVFFDIAVFTNLTHEHLDYHGSLKNYFFCKAKIFSRLKKTGKAVINTDDQYVKRIRKMIKGKCVTYGLKKGAEISARIERLNTSGSSFTVTAGNKDKFNVATKLAGLHNISNILAAAAACFSLGIDPEAIKKGIERVRSIPGRLEPVESGQAFKVFVDYAHTQDALKNVLEFLNKIKQRNIITVFGCGGDRDRAKRPLMAQVAQEGSDFVIVTSDNPRSESPEKIAQEVEGGMKRKEGGYTVILDRHSAIENALKRARKGDIVLIAGKGHEKFQIIGEKKIPFDDVRVAEKLLKGYESGQNRKRSETHLYRHAHH